MTTDKICCNCRWYKGVNACTGIAHCDLKKIIVLWNEQCKSIWLIPKRLKIRIEEVKKINESEGS